MKSLQLSGTQCLEYHSGVGHQFPESPQEEQQCQIHQLLLSSGSPTYSAICPLVWFITFLLLPSALSHFESLCYMVLLRELLNDALTAPFDCRLDLLLQDSAHWNIRRDPETRLMD
ncbi:hypothetical protein H5410_021305 [Solanum commersonii]|uniref:Uncharacterized protein n=1 Tax=Solanum commersonii TaxID=4109 RepID=A0A9J5ZDV8_SOLCO|nr:hypothetical protein H5410_021305 [Solanum commersonii]